MQLNLFLHTTANSGIGKYAQDIVASIKTPVKIHTLLFDRSREVPKYLGNVYIGTLQVPFFSGWYLNSHFQSLAFSRFYKELLNDDDEGMIYHYADMVLKPFLPVERSVITVHDFFRVSKKYIDKYGYRHVKYLADNLKRYKGFQYVITDSIQVMKEALEIGFESKPVVIYPPVAPYFRPLQDKVTWRKKWSLPEDKILILSVSTDDPRKNLRTVVETVRSLGNKFALVRVGPPIYGAYNFSNLSGEEMNEVYNSCDVLLFPTFDEGFGYPLIEAMRVGLPVVSSDIDIIREVTSGAAVLVHPDVEHCKLGIKEALSDSDNYRKKGLERSEHFSIEMFSEMLSKFYASILKH